MRRFDIIPDPERHFWISVIKSLMRIAGFVGLIYSTLGGVLLLVLAEILGIAEEMV
jgi:hypothetical protein|tara:strand:+ start:1271 stop:1438 length:168 start_codon:yes stop_codon:yes gene_type:complete